MTHALMHVDCEAPTKPIKWHDNAGVCFPQQISLHFGYFDGGLLDCR